MSSTHFPHALLKPVCFSWIDTLIGCLKHKMSHGWLAFQLLQDLHLYLLTQSVCLHNFCSQLVKASGNTEKLPEKPIGDTLYFGNWAWHFIYIWLRYLTTPWNCIYWQLRLVCISSQYGHPVMAFQYPNTEFYTLDYYIIQKRAGFVHHTSTTSRWNYENNRGVWAT